MVGGSALLYDEENEGEGKRGALSEVAFLGLQGAAAAPSKRRARHVSVTCLQVAEMELLHVESADIFIPYGAGVRERALRSLFYTFVAT